MARDKQDNAGMYEANITESIDELESLIEESKLPAKPQNEIPVLNDIVDPAEVSGYTQGKSSKAASTTTSTIEDISLEKLNELVNSVDRKLSSELDSLVDILKETIKDSIIDDLKEELKKGATQTEPAPSKTDSSDKPSEWALPAVAFTIICLFLKIVIFHGRFLLDFVSWVVLPFTSL